MIYKLTAQAGLRRQECGLVAEHSGMPSPSDRSDWGAVTLLWLGSVVRRMSVMDRDSQSSPHRSREVTVWCAARLATRALKRCCSTVPGKNKGAALLTKATLAFRRIGSAVRQGTLTITGSNVRLGTEMPVALSPIFA